MVVTMDPRHYILNPGFAPVFRRDHVGRALPDSLLVVRVDAELALVHRPRTTVAHLSPACPAIFRSDDAALGIFDDCVNDAGISAVDIKSDPAGHSVRKVFSKLCPGSSSVNCLVHSASRAAAVESPRGTTSLIGCSVKGTGALRIHRDISYAGVLVDEQGLCPGFSPIGCLVDPSLAIRSPKMSENCDVDDIGIARIDHHSPDVLGILEAHVLPGFSAVERAINPIAPRR